MNQLALGFRPTGYLSMACVITAHVYLCNFHDCQSLYLDDLYLQSRSHAIQILVTYSPIWYSLCWYWNYNAIVDL